MTKAKSKHNNIIGDINRLSVSVTHSQNRFRKSLEQTVIRLDAFSLSTVESVKNHVRYSGSYCGCIECDVMEF